MQQAEIKNTSKALSRRSAIALVGVATIAASAAASVMPASARLPIGELSYPELAEEFAAVYERWRLLNAESQAQLDHYQAGMFAATGTKDHPNYGQAGYEEYRQISRRVSEEGPKSLFDEDNIDEINGAIDTICKRVLTLPARSLADLALKARAAALLKYDLWTGDEPTDYTFMAIRCLVDDLCRLAGVEVLPGVDIVANEICEVTP